MPRVRIRRLYKGPPSTEAHGGLFGAMGILPSVAIWLKCTLWTTQFECFIIAVLYFLLLWCIWQSKSGIFVLVSCHSGAYNSVVILELTIQLLLWSLQFSCHPLDYSVVIVELTIQLSSV